MKNVVKEWITSIIGVVLMLLAIYDFYQNEEFGYNVGLLILGLIFLRMKDAWISRLFNGIFKKFVGILIILLIFLSSCITQEKCYQRFPPEVKTETVIKTVTIRHDSIIQLPPDSSHITALIECDSLGNAYIKEIIDLKTGKVKPRIVIKNNYITADCVVDSQLVYLTWWNSRVKESKIEKVEPQPIEDKKSWWRSLMERFRGFFEVSGYILWIGLIILAVKKFVFKI